MRTHLLLCKTGQVSELMFALLVELFEHLGVRVELGGTETWKSSTAADDPLQSTFVRELKKELNLRSEVAARRADLNKNMLDQ